LRNPARRPRSPDHHDFAEKPASSISGIVPALDVLARGDAGVLVVAKLNRATRSVMGAADFFARSQREGWKLVALDLGFDPATPTGELVVTIMAAVAQWERRAIGVQTREALAAKRAPGRSARPSVGPLCRDRRSYC